MPTILYKWDFETGDTQGWALGSYSSLDSTSQLQGTYSVKYARLIHPGETVEDVVMYISNIDLSTATKPLLVLLVKDTTNDALANRPFELRVYVKDSAGNILLSIFERILFHSNGVTKVAVFDLSSVAGKTGLTIEIRQYVHNDSGLGRNKIIYIDSIHIIDGGDKEYQIALMGLNNIDRTTLSYTIPDADKALPSDTTRFAINLATPPHPLTEGSNIFEYTAICDQGSASISSAVDDIWHASTITALTTSPAYFNSLSARIYPKTASTTWYGYDETVVVTFWDASWNLKIVYVFRVAITINPYSPTYASALINTTYGSTWSGQRDFTVKVHARSFSVRIYVRFLVGDNTVVQIGTAKLEVYSSDYSTKYGESSVDLTAGAALRGATISNLPVDTELKFRISWSITANARVVLEVRPEFIVY